MARTLKVIVFHDIKEVELLIKAINTSDVYNTKGSKDMFDVLEQIREMFLKETKKKEKSDV
jgi:hypothetical protein